ncbi:fungal hydrophobin-domain-containing protein [Flagelloscypha sp. PMI_526]|nr:fungal hydrophobin-domain-containing protein [Flagelloscypha sp. PMI_526]
MSTSSLDLAALTASVSPHTQFRLLSSAAFGWNIKGRHPRSSPNRTCPCSLISTSLQLGPTLVPSTQTLFNMIFAKLMVFVLPAFAAAVAVGRREDKCNTGPVQCCNQVVKANDPSHALLVGLLNLGLLGTAVPIGLTCVPINIVGAGGTSCTGQTVCCENNNYNGLVNIGCSPVAL